MNLIIINCSPRIKVKSNTNIIIKAFAKGYTEKGNTVEIYHLSELKKWEEIREAFYNNDNILMAIPLYVENIPGIMIEFLETLSPKMYEEGENKTKISFILQGGFAEASQLRCGEKYLEVLPSYLNCEYRGTLIKGNMFITHMLPPEATKKTLDLFTDMGKSFAKEDIFAKNKVDEFAGPEYFSKLYISLAILTGPLQKKFFNIFFKKNGCEGKLTAKPYKKYIE